MKLLTKVVLFVITLSCVFSCIALDDEFFPTVSNNIIPDKVYYYYDSIHVNVMFRDNALIQETNVKVALLEQNGMESNTVAFTFDSTYSNVATRLLKFDSTFIVPLNAETGKYLLETTNKDASNNYTKDTTYFYIDTDTTSPSIEQFSVRSTNEKNTIDNQFCKGDVVEVNALVTDNIELYRVGVAFDEGETIYFDTEGRSTGIGTLLQNEISIPSDISNGTHQFKLLIEDIYGNTTMLSETISIECENDPAELISVVEESGKDVPSNGIIPLNPGEQFNLTSLIFEDTGGLDSARLEVTRYQGENDPIVETPIDVDLESAIETDLSELFSDYLSFGFDKIETNEGDLIEVSIKIKDLNQTWENASSFNFSLQSKKDEKPEIVVHHLVINGVNTEVDPDEEYDLTDLLLENQNLQIGIDGVINEEVGLASVRYSFESDHRSIQSFGRIINLSEEELTFPVSIEEVIATTFPINYNEHLDGKITYNLEITVTDLKGQTDAINFILSADY
ncbi:Ig-like domain repeat protein [Flammeovirga sp. EKP202]|uniref:Ig-like domain repeat protein n=1 Tax=Flammeovirga sp. EKP202 TaxID=2770592 RepID=UPI00165FDB25|nr:Ig-like domain repeat protein [Flammeovirga sp. EKP202]MBD0404878.1 Ig-like domain repeat protein [Flammeovirga sp. EKP202]